MSRAKREYAWHIEWRDPNELIPYEHNAKIHDEKNIGEIAESIRRYGWQQPLTITNGDVVIIGHGRRLAAIELGCKVPCKVVEDDLTDAEIRQLRIVDNKTNESQWDFDELQKELSSLDFGDFDFGLDDMMNEVAAMDEDALFQSEDEAPPGELSTAEEDDYDGTIPEKPKSKRSEIYQLGRHRLMCGDSTNLDDVKKLMNGERADLLLTDPPYNVNYQGGTQDHLKIANDNMGDTAFRQFLTMAFRAADAVMKAGAVFYIWHSDTEGYNFRGAVRDTGWQLRECLIWNKNALVLGRQDYHYKHEPCLYGWKGGSSHVWLSDRKQTTVIDFKKPLRADIHPTMKPIPLFEYQIHNSCPKGGAVLDLFGGSGTTIMAAEQNGRTGYVMELDPRYVDAIIKRFEDFTGEKARKISG